MTPMRDYDEALQRLESLQRYLGAGPVTDRLAKLQITIKVADAPGSPDRPPAALVEGVEKFIRDDLQRYGARLIHAAQDDVRKAANALRATIAADLNSSNMQD